MMTGLTLLVCAAATALALARMFRGPAIPFLILGGVALQAVTPVPEEVLDPVLTLGVSFLLFALGLELDPRRIRVQRRAVVRVGLLQFAALGVLGWGAARALGFGPREAAFVALALPASSTLVSVRLLQRRRQMYEPFGRLVLGVLLLQDVLVILLIPLVLGTAHGPRAVVEGVALVLALGAAALGARRWITPHLLRVAEEREAVLLGALALLFAFLAGSWNLGLPPVVGGFLAGVALARFPVNGVVRLELAPLRDFFSAIFFTGLGALVRLPTAPELLQALALGALVVVVTPPLVAFIGERAGFTSRSALEAGLLLSQTSEISLVVAFIGMRQGELGESLFVVLALATLGTMLLTPLISTDSATRLLMRLGRRRRRTILDGPEGHVLVVGAGSTGMPLVEDLVLEGHAVAVVDDDPGLVSALREAGVHAVRGEASDLATLRAAGLSRARVVCSTARRVRDNETLLREAGGIPVLVRVFEETEAAWVREQGGEPILYSHAAAQGLLRWFAEEEGRVDPPRGGS